MKSELEQLQKATEQAIQSVDTMADLDDIRVDVLGKKGQLTGILKGLKDVSPEERPVFGQLANAVKATLSDQLDSRRQALDALMLEAQLNSDSVDVTMPSTVSPLGAKHPLQLMIDEVSAIFKRVGYSVESGPEVEDTFHNFEALNIPADHPARDMHDTFYLEDGRLLRTHTSPVQIHVMEKETPPLRLLVPGKVFRCDADVSHSPVFNQVEGLVVDKKITFADLKGTLEYFLKELFGQDKTVRLRPSYFPFTEPSVEVDVECMMCAGDGCSLCKDTGWLEVMGAGMVNRNVFRSVGYDPDQVSGFAFGAGIDRLAMLKYRIPDIRLLYENDLRTLEQFT
ncbi:phenylalanine--tRNA ligase subunit alpha [bacterium]|nr:phenylalanine--tRNA ligase subunit alpha [bacterium]